MTLSSMPAATPIAIAVALRRPPAGWQVLIGQRPAETVLAGYWEFPGGKVEAGEAAETAAVRECREEAGLEVRVDRLLSTQAYSYAHGDVALHFYCCQATTDESPRPPYRWVAVAQLADFEFPPANAPVLQLLATLARVDETDLGPAAAID